MERNFLRLKLEVKELSRGQKYAIESSKLIMRMAGANTKIMDQLNQYLGSTAEAGKESTIGVIEKTNQCIESQVSLEESCHISNFAETAFADLYHFIF